MMEWDGLKEKLQHVLKLRLGDNLLPFIEKVKTESLEVVENAENSKLRKVIINNIPHQPTEEMWKLNLEMPVQGFSRLENKTVDAALALLAENTLHVYLIELKTTLKSEYSGKKRGKSTLFEIKGKFEDSISRFYFISTIDNKHEHANYKKVKIIFKGIVFYNDDRTSEAEKGDKDCAEIYSIFKGEKTLLTCTTILGTTKIPVKFFQNPDKSDTIEENFDSISR